MGTDRLFARTVELAAQTPEQRSELGKMAVEARERKAGACTASAKKAAAKKKNAKSEGE